MHVDDCIMMKHPEVEKIISQNSKKSGPSGNQMDLPAEKSFMFLTN